MIIEFKNNNIYNSLKDIFIKQDGKKLNIFYGATGDLYFDIFGNYRFNESGIRTSKFSIDKDSGVYSFLIIFLMIFYITMYMMITIQIFFDNEKILNKKFKVQKNLCHYKKGKKILDR